MNLFVLAGTEDGRTLAAELQARGHQVLVSTLTEYGAEIAEGQGLKARSGALEEAQFKSTLNEKGIETLIDATHPFAERISALARKVCGEVNIRYLRWERPRGEYPEHPLLYKVADLESAADLASRLGRRIFLTTGSKNLKEWMSFASLKACELFVRVLPTSQVLKECEDVGLKPYQITAAQGPFSQKFNEALWEQLKIDAVITKESGAIGGTADKVQACLNLGIPLIIIERPASTAGENHPAMSNIAEFIRKVEINHGN